jgi:hypothetical protein
LEKREPLTKSTFITALPAFVVLRYRADHNPRPALLDRHMEVLDADVSSIYVCTELTAYASAV